MKKIVITLITVLFTGLIFAQPGKPRGPGGQYGERMEMMMIWKLTDNLELTEDQAEKFFPNMREHQKQMSDIRKEEKELFTPLYKKIKKSEEISKFEADKLLKEILNLTQKRSKTLNSFVKKSGNILNPTQQVKFLMFEGIMKQQVKSRMKDRYKPSTLRPRVQKPKRGF